MAEGKLSREQIQVLHRVLCTVLSWRTHQPVVLTQSCPPYGLYCITTCKQARPKSIKWSIACTPDSHSVHRDWKRVCVRPRQRRLRLAQREWRNGT